MTRRILYIISAVLPFLFGCQSEMTVTEDSYATVSVGISLPGTVHTKTVGDGTNVDILYYEIWNHEDNAEGGSIGDKRLASGSVRRSTTEGEDFELNVTLLNGQTYDFLLWAQVETSEAYDVTSLRKITTDYDNVAGNDESRAAFFGTTTVTMNGHQIVDVELARPFAQLNVGASTLISDVSPEGIQVTGSVITVKSPANCFDVATGRGSTTKVADAVFVGDGVMDEKASLTINPNEDEKIELLDYHYLSMNYFFVNGDEISTVDVELEFMTDIGTVRHFVPNVRVRENHKTNIVGDVFFKTAGFDIVVEKVFNPGDIDIDANL